MNKQQKQILFCVESNPQSRTEYPYITETLRHFFEENSSISYRMIFMGSKTRYRDRKVVQDIQRKRKDFRGKETRVIYCVDTDDCFASGQDQKILQEIQSYCDGQGYDFMFFCKDIEDVFWQKQIRDGDKVRYSAQFRRDNVIRKLNVKKLQQEEYVRHSSNILLVLERYWTWKSNNAYKEAQWFDQPGEGANL